MRANMSGVTVALYLNQVRSPRNANATMRGDIYHQALLSLSSAVLRSDFRLLFWLLVLRGGCHKDNSVRAKMNTSLSIWPLTLLPPFEDKTHAVTFKVWHVTFPLLSHLANTRSCQSTGLTSSTLMFSLALVSNSLMSICSANFCASAVSTTLEFGSSFLLPTKKWQSGIIQTCIGVSQY